MHRLTRDSNSIRRRPQARAQTFRAGRIAAIAREQYAIVKLVGLPFQFLKEAVDPIELLVSLPDNIPLAFGEARIRNVNIQIRFFCERDKIAEIFGELRSIPANDRSALKRAAL